MEYSEKAIDILTAAKTLFAKLGFKAVTTKEIANKAKVNEVTIFRLFQNKRNLLDHVLAYHFKTPDFDKFLNYKEENIERFLLSVGALLKESFTENMDLFRIEFYNIAIINGRTRVFDFPNELKRVIKAYLINIQRMNESDAKTFSASFLSAAYGICMNTFFIPVFDPPEDYDQCLNFLVKKYS